MFRKMLFTFAFSCVSCGFLVATADEIVPAPKEPAPAKPAEGPEKTREQIAAERIEAKLLTIKEQFGFMIDSQTPTVAWHDKANWHHEDPVGLKLWGVSTRTRIGKTGSNYKRSRTVEFKTREELVKFLASGTAQRATKIDLYCTYSDGSGGFVTFNRLSEYAKEAERQRTRVRIDVPFGIVPK